MTYSAPLCRYAGMAKYLIDYIGEALADLEANFDVFAAEMGVARAGALLAAARNCFLVYELLDSLYPTDELVGRVVPLIRELTEMARRSATDPDWLGSLDATVWTLAILDALAVTADEEAAE